MSVKVQQSHAVAYSSRPGAALEAHGGMQS